MSSFSQRPRSICRQRGLQNGIERLCWESNFWRQVGQVTRVAMPVLFRTGAVAATSYESPFGFLLFDSPPELLLPESADFEPPSPEALSALAAFLYDSLR